MADWMRDMNVGYANMDVRTVKHEDQEEQKEEEEQDVAADVDVLPAATLMSCGRFRFWCYAASPPSPASCLVMQILLICRVRRLCKSSVCA